MAGLIGKLFHKQVLVVGLTDWGKKKHDSYGKEGLDMDVLVYLNDNGDASIREISDNLGKDQTKVESCVKTMMSEGLLQPRSRN